MREFDPLVGYPGPKKPRVVSPNIRTIQNRIVAAYRGKEFYDGDRNNGYGGFKYDGRWKSIAQNMCREYGLQKQSAVLQVGCEKGFLLHEFHQLDPDMKIYGTEISDYAIGHAMEDVKPFIQKVPFTELPFKDGEFDLVIAIGAVYSLNLADAIRCLRDIQRVSKGRSFITLGAYDTEEDRRLFEWWTLLGTTVLHVDEWVEVLRHVGFTGDYRFNTARSLNLVKKKETEDETISQTPCR